MFDLAGHVALVTGGNSGIGLGMAEGLVRAGASVCIWGMNPTKNAAALDQLRAVATADARIESAIVDVSDEGAVDAGFAALVETFGRLDSCFANAAVTGAFGNPRFVDIELADWRSEMAINLDGAFLTFRGAARQMIAQGEGGSLIGTSSLAARFGAPRDAGYGAAKAGMISLTQTRAVELGKYRIRANALLPGWTRSPQFDAWLENPEVTQRIMPRIPIKRWGEPQDWQGIAVYLASRESSFHTGDVFCLDGGYGVF